MSLRAAETVPDGDAIDLDLARAVGAPTIDEAPVARAMLLAQLNSFSPGGHDAAIRPGHPYLMTRSGEWRQFDLPRYGFRAIAYGEMSMAISQDGRRVALADPTGLVTIDLDTNDFRRFDLPVTEAVALGWSADGETLSLKDRDGIGLCGPQGCILDVATGDLAAVSYDIFHASLGDNGQVFEVVAPRQRPAQIVTWRDGSPPVRVDLGHHTAPYTAGRPVAATWVSFTQCSDARRAKDRGGVVVADPTDGTVIAMLANEPSGPRCLLGAKTWLTDHHLLVGDWLNGALWVWDVRASRVAQVATSRTRGQNVYVARDVMAVRLRASLRH